MKTQPNIKELINEFNNIVESEGSNVKLLPSVFDKYKERDCFKVSLCDKYVELSLTDDYVSKLKDFLKEHEMKAQIEETCYGVFILPFVYKDSPDGINKISYAELCGAMREHNDMIDERNKLRKENEKHICYGDDVIKGVIVIKEDSFDVQYPLESRSYEVSNNNKAWIAGMGGYSIFATSLDKSDPCVRIERYLKAEHGGDKGWEIEYCYML